MDYTNIILTGYLKESTRNILDKYLLRKYKEASEKHFSYDEFFNGCTEVINTFYKEMDKGLFKRKNDLYLMQNWSKNGMKGSRDEPKEPSEHDLKAVTEFEKELSTLNRNKFPVNLFHFTNGAYTGNLYENDIIYIEKAIKKAMISESSIQDKNENNNEFNKPTIPDVNLFSNSMNHSIFGKILVKKREDGKENTKHYEKVFENWATTRINEFTTSNQFGERTKWMTIFINFYCKKLNDFTVKIATGAHLNYKNEQKWESKYTGGFLNLFHFLDYGSGYSNTIETILMTLKLNWDQDPILASKMQSYCIDRINELKRLVEINYFIKKDNPIFVWYDLIITRFKNAIDFKETELRAKENKSIHLQPTPPNETKKRISKAIACSLFFQIYGGIEINNESLNLDNWESLKDKFFEQRLKSSSTSYTFEEKIKHELIQLENLTINDTNYGFLRDRYKNYLLLKINNFTQNATQQDNAINTKVSHSNIFNENGFEIWTSMFNDFKITSSSRTDVRFMFDTMKRKGLIHNTVSQKALLDWINLTYELPMDKLSYKNFKNDAKRIAIFEKTGVEYN